MTRATRPGTCLVEGPDWSTAFADTMLCVCNVMPGGILDCPRCLWMDRQGLFTPTEEPSPDGSRYVKAYIPKRLRLAVFARDGHECLHCGATEDLSCDHVVPESRGGATTLDNLQVLCRPCNSRKGAR